MKIDILDRGFIECLGVMGNDMTTVNTARVSFGKESSEMTERDEKLVQYLANHNHTCYDSETEVLTGRGWIPWPEVSEQDVLAAFNIENRHIEFEQPVRIVREQYQGKMYCVKKSGVDLCVTPNHQMVVGRRDKDAALRFESAQDLDGKPARYIKAGVYSATGGIEPPFETDDGYMWAWLVGFFLGDGCADSPNRISFHLKKVRKIDALQNACRSLGLELRELENGMFSIVSPGLGRYMKETFYFDGKKTLPVNIIRCLSRVQRANLLLGLRASDGSSHHGTWNYHTSSKKLRDQVQILALLSGQAAHIQNKSDGMYVVSMLSRGDMPRVNDSGTKDDFWIDYDGMVYCATVSTGALLVRRNGIPIVSGNSPFRHAQLMFRFKAPLFVARQLLFFA